DLRWQYRVHEQILPAVRRAGGEVIWTETVITHVGYQEPGLTRRKLERNFRLLKMDEADRPDDPFTLFNLGWAKHEMGEPAEALRYLRRSLELAHNNASIAPKLYSLVVNCHRQLRQPGESLAACREGRGHFPDDLELLFLEGLVLRE